MITDLFTQWKKLLQQKETEYKGVIQPLASDQS